MSLHIRCEGHVPRADDGGGLRRSNKWERAQQSPEKEGYGGDVDDERLMSAYSSTLEGGRRGVELGVVLVIIPF